MNCDVTLGTPIAVSIAVPGRRDWPRFLETHEQRPETLRASLIMATSTSGRCSSSLVHSTPSCSCSVAASPVRLFHKYSRQPISPLGHTYRGSSQRGLLRSLLVNSGSGCLPCSSLISPSQALLSQPLSQTGPGRKQSVRGICRAEPQRKGPGRDRGATDYMYDGGWREGRAEEQPRYDYAPPRESCSEPPRPPSGPEKGGPSDGGFSNATKAFILAAFIVGIGTGVWFATEVNFYPSNVASTELIDRKTPNTEICMANGYSSMVFDQRLFVSFNPFNVYVSQPEVKPGCVLRQSNIRELERRNLIKPSEVAECTKKMNTFAFVGDLEGDAKHKPEISCVYHSEDAENMFLRNPKAARMGDGVADVEE